MTDRVEQEKPEKLKKSSWWWPGVVASSLAGAAVVASPGIGFRKMSGPTGAQGHSAQVCLSCGAKRLFDDTTFGGFKASPYVPIEQTAWESSPRSVS